MIYQQCSYVNHGIQSKYVHVLSICFFRWAFENYTYQTILQYYMCYCTCIRYPESWVTPASTVF